MAAVEVRVPGDKSITHRALILGSLAAGRSRITGALDAEDSRSTAAALRGLGVDVGDLALPEIYVGGRGTDGWRAPADTVDCGNSGTTARLLLGALAGCPFSATLSGDASLRGRPMRRVTEPLAAAGASYEELGAAGCLPIRVHGRRPLAPVAHDSPRSSAQVKSALLLAGITGRAPVRVTEPVLSRDHTERMLRGMGASVQTEELEGRWEIELEADAPLSPLDVRVPGDPSSAAFFLALGLLLGPVRVSGMCLNPTRTGVLGVLGRMGASLRVEHDGDSCGEPVGSVEAQPGGLGGTVIAPAEVPALLDEVPILAALAATAAGETRFEGVGELRVKETDRIAAMVENLRALGVDAEDAAEHLVVWGRPGALRGRVGSFGDHRIAMAFAVIGAVPGNEIEIEGREAVDISFPTFWTELERVRTELEAT